MAFERVRKGKYRYREERWREGGKVRSKSTYLGVVAFIKANLEAPKMSKELNDDELNVLQTEMDAKANHQIAVREDFEETHGTTLGSNNPTPVDKPAPVVEDIINTEANASSVASPSATPDAPSSPAEPDAQSPDGDEGTAS